MVVQCVAGLVWLVALLLLAPKALAQGLAGWAVVALAVVVSGVHAMGGGVQAGASAAARGVVAVVLRWTVVVVLLVALARQPGAIVWALAAGAMVAQAAYMATAVTFKRV